MNKRSGLESIIFPIILIIQLFCNENLQQPLADYHFSVQGKLVFQDGPLVTAMREGHWVILDELNLAPTDILEALNRVLDDNRELYIPETQDVIHAHAR